MARYPFPIVYLKRSICCSKVSGFEQIAPGGQWFGENTLSPLMDVKEKDDGIIVTTDVPGVDKKDVEIGI